jgi:uncharacterized membrane protein YgcG
MLRNALAVLFAVAVAAAPSSAIAQTERIHNYHAAIDVLEDGSLAVTETIEVTAAGNKIKRGIYRDFPTVYHEGWARIEVPFHVVSVKRDGRGEPFRTERRSNGVRVYAGSENVYLPRGKYTYEIAYTTKFQLGFFADHDELYWNVTGNGWEFPIDRAGASVRLPAKVPRDKVRHEGYTGPAGSKARGLTSKVDEKTGLVEFTTTRPLAVHEGLTIVVEFPKGYVREPTAAERRGLFFRSNRPLWAALGGLLVVLGYYVVAWVAVGRDPPGDVIIPQFEPPLGLPPACTRYLREMGYDRKCFTAAVINLAVKRFATIEERDGSYTLRRANGAAREKLSPGEQAVMNDLLSAGKIEFKQTNHTTIRRAIESLGRQLSREFDRKLFFKNRGWLVPGWIISALAVVAVATSNGAEAFPIMAFLSIWLSGWTFACMVLVLAAVGVWKSTFALRKTTVQRLGSFGTAVAISLFAGAFLLGEGVGVTMLAANTTIWIVPMLVAVVGINWLFWHLIKQPTVEGRRIMDHIEGFRMYLGTAEKEYLNQLHEPERTPELFERYLPYALALDVENEWAQKFADVLATSSIGSDGGYQPAWYQGSDWNPARAGAFAGGLGGALGSAIASSATAPGSSSGGGGGGSSGGGGGGGGGGGW